MLRARKRVTLEIENVLWRFVALRVEELLFAFVLLQIIMFFYM